VCAQEMLRSSRSAEIESASSESEVDSYSDSMSHGGDGDDSDGDTLSRTSAAIVGNQMEDEEMAVGAEDGSASSGASSYHTAEGLGEAGCVGK
jgi:hypothetical protein